MTNDWDNPEGWKEWIMAYKGWSEAEWESFLRRWGREDRQQLMAETGVHIFNWNACHCLNFLGSKHSVLTSVGLAEGMLYEQMKGMRDITLVGHSKGGNLVLNFVQDLNRFSWGGGAERPKNAVLIDAPTWQTSAFLANGKPTLPIVVENGVHVVNIYNAYDPINGFILGHTFGATNHLDVGVDINARHDRLWPFFAHSRKDRWANIVLHWELQVQYDHGVERAGPGL